MSAPEEADGRETAALAQLEEHAARFGWAYLLVTRRDVENNLERPLSETEWSALTSTPSWSSLLEEPADVAWVVVQDALEEAGIE